jgi:hypothetical protein
MPRWLQGALTRIRALARERKVRFTQKAFREVVALDLGLDADDCCDVLERLTATDSGGRLKSTITLEWMYVFKPDIARARLYLKVILRDECIIVSFHEEGSEDGDEDAE